MAKYLDYGGLEHLVGALDNKIAAAGQGEYLPLSGGTLTGKLTVQGETTLSLVTNADQSYIVTADRRGCLYSEAKPSDWNLVTGGLLSGGLFNGGSVITGEVRSNITWPNSGSYLYSCVGKKFETEEYGTLYLVSFLYWMSGTGPYYFNITGPNGDGAGDQKLIFDKQGSYFAANNVWLMAGSTVTIQAGYPM